MVSKETWEVSGVGSMVDMLVNLILLVMRRGPRDLFVCAKRYV